MAVVSHYNVAPVIDIFGAVCRTRLWVAWPATSTRSLTLHASNYRAVLESLYAGRFRRCELLTSAF